MLRDKKGVHNSFKSPDYINALDWDNLKRYPQVFDYYRGLTELRRNHPAFRMADAEMVRRHLEFIDSPQNVVTFRLKGHANGDTWNDIIVILNASKRRQCVSIPAGTYTSVCQDGLINLSGIATHKVSSTIQVNPQEALILYR